MNKTVCILTAGKGTRMGNLGLQLNKALLPINGKAIISHIIEKFPPNTEFIIGLGYLGNQVQEYLNLAHETKEFRYVEVNPYEGEKSGPGYSLLCCKSLLQKPFYFVSCDTLWTNEINWDEQNDWLGTASIHPTDSPNYCNLKIVDGVITDVVDKALVITQNFSAFVGLCHIYNYSVFWHALEDAEKIAGEHQISNGIRALIKGKAVISKPIDWIDVGDEKKYKAAVSKFTNYDFSKTDEALYILNGNVIKFFSNATITHQRIEKAKLNPVVFPSIVKSAGQFFAYAYQDGKTLYQFNNEIVFKNLLDWLKRNLWIPKDVNPITMVNACKAFYQTKTLDRLKLYSKKYPKQARLSIINGEFIPSVEELLPLIKWEILFQGVPCFIHGDLQFDNILFNYKNKSFLLLDWRQDFSGYIDFGDIYYDLAKLYGGIVLNYDYIKLNLLTYSEDKDKIFFDFPQRYKTNSYRVLYNNFLTENRFDLRKVKLLVALIYLNMAPLHNYPFDKLLHAFGRQLLFREVSNSNSKP
jgi:NDP-sugar pyrophosphorylase family protein